MSANSWLRACPFYMAEASQKLRDRTGASGNMYDITLVFFFLGGGIYSNKQIYIYIYIFF